VIEAYSPLGTGRHLGDDRVRQIADRLGRTPAQVLVRWCLQRDLVVLPKSTHRERIELNAQVFDFTLSDDDMAALDALDTTGGTDRALERKCNMSKRAAAVARTRQRIVDAARELHGEQGIAATSWDDIAARAGVGVGTVYRHFRSLDELVPACGEITMQVVALPDPATVVALFEHVTEPAERIERLVREAFAIYERGAPELRAIRREGDVHPRLARDSDQFDASLSALVNTALGPLDATQQDRAVARAMVDLNTWEALRDQGLGPAESVAAISDMLAMRLTARQG